MAAKRWRRGLAGAGLLAAVLGVPAPAFALQTHAYSGFYLHQIAHLFFLAAMVFFALGIRRSRFALRRPWRLMAAGAWLLALWNLWAFGGHFVEVLVPESSLLRETGRLVPRIALVSWRELAYFIIKMDHLLAVPALFCFYFGMRGIHRAIGGEKGQRTGGGA
ncbi:MAG: hypothetical protein AB1413_11635 [Thermodesulfobacteriota bacterium]